MTRPKRIAGAIAHRSAILLYILFALFPLYWLLKVSVTPNDLLYSEGVRLWPSRTSIEHYLFVLEHSDFPRFFRNSVIVSGATAFIVTILASCASRRASSLVTAVAPSGGCIALRGCVGNACPSRLIALVVDPLGCGRGAGGSARRNYFVAGQRA